MLNKLKAIWKKYKGYLPSLLVSLAIPLAVGMLSALLTKNNMSIYNEIKTPPLSPPAILFPIVWSILYILMGVSSFLVYKNKTAENGELVKSALTSYAISLGLNFLWSVLFFNLRVFAIAVVCLLLLLFFIIKSTLAYLKIKPTAAYLQIPYILWVAFALYLNIAIAIIN